MSDFTRPEYTSYVELCRSLRLKREFQIGDWVHDYDPERDSDSVDVIAWDDNRDPTRTTETIFWVPQLSDWLEMLEASGHEDITIEQLYGKVHYIRREWRCGRTDETIEPGKGRTREEAAVRFAIESGVVQLSEQLEET